jgi:glycosyltransferase involved in cell wall biosynthesis
MPRVLHVLSQRPSLTGSGVTLDALVRHAAGAGWEQRVVVGVPAEEPQPGVGGLPAERVHPLVFGGEAIAFPVPGMSDVMPYPSTVFSTMDEGRREAYRAAWSAHLAPLLERFNPDVIHAHHVWILSALLKDLAPQVPVVTQCHATGLRQMELCPHLAAEVREGCARNERFVVLHEGHAAQLAGALAVEPRRIRVVGAGYREDLFHARGRAARPGPRLLYVGKYSAAKGLPWLLDAVERVAVDIPDLELHVAGSGAGAEAEALRERMRALAPRVVLHGQLSQAELAEVARRCAVCVLPSFYEGVPLVLVEALAAGCRLVATALPGVRSPLARHLGPALRLVPVPPLESVDRPRPEGLPAFVGELVAAIRESLAAPLLGDPAETMPGALEPFRWTTVFLRVESVWRELLEDAPPS